MSRDLLEKILKNRIDLNCDSVINFFVQFKKNDFIYPSVIKRKLKLDDKKIYDILTMLEEANVIKMYYEFFCYTCNTSKGLYEYFSQIEDSLICDNCDTNLNIHENIKVVYKVVI